MNYKIIEYYLFFIEKYDDSLYVSYQKITQTLFLICKTFNVDKNVSKEIWS